MKTRPGKTTAFLVAAALASAGMAAAAETKEDEGSYGGKAISMGEVVVTATRTERETKDVPVSVTVVTAEEIKARNIQNLDEAVSYAVGVWNRRMRGQADVGASVNLRGVYGNERNLVLLDNQPVNSTIWGGVPWSGMNLDQVERIEIVRGPFSALYGINAMGGVINVITKTPKKRTLSAEGGYGTDETTAFRVNYGDRFFDRLSLSVGGERKHTQGYPTFIQTKTASAGAPQAGDVAVETPERTTDVTGKTTKYIVGDTGDNVTTDWNVYAKAAYEFSKGHSLSLHYTHSEQSDDWGKFNSYLHDSTGKDVTSGTVSFDGQRLSVKEADFLGWIAGGRDNDIVVANYRNDLTDGLTLRVDGGLTYQDRYYTIPDVWWPATATRDGGPGSYYEYPSRVANVTAQADVAVGQSLVATVGTGLRWDHGEQDVWNLSDWRDSGDKGDKTTHIEGDNIYRSAFAQAEWRPVEALTVIPALRFDYWQSKGETEIQGAGKEDFDTRSDSMWSPKLSAGYQLPGGAPRLRASAGIGYKPPEIDKLYRMLPPGGPGEAPVLPNRDLDPERLLSWEAGFDQVLLGDRIRLSSTYYENRIEDALFQMVDPDGATRWHSGAEQKIRGLEAELLVKPAPWLALFGNLTRQWSEITKNDANPAVEGNDVPYVPDLSWNVGAELSRGKASLRVAASHVDKAFTREDNTDTAENVPTANDGYTKVDAALALPLTDQLLATVSVTNLFDEEYYLYWKAPGRQWLATVRYDF